MSADGRLAVAVRFGTATPIAVSFRANCLLDEFPDKQFAVATILDWRDRDIGYTLAYSACGGAMTAPSDEECQVMAGRTSTKRVPAGRLLLDHPGASPDLQQLTFPTALLLEPPSIYSSCRTWAAWLGQLERLQAARPNDPNLPLYLEKAQSALEWRKSIPITQAFWAIDQPEGP